MTAMLAVALLLPAQLAVAQSVVIRQFSAQSSSGSAFVLTQRVRPLPEGRTLMPNDLATDFAAFGVSDDRQARETKSNLAPTESPTLRHRFARVPASPGCLAAPYRPSPGLSAVAERRRATWYTAMVSAACEAGLPIGLFDALIIAESGYNPSALSPKGAAGLAQLMPDSARQLGVGNVWDPVSNMRGGAHLLRAQLDEFGRFDLALAAYNAGAKRVRRTRQVPSIPETLHYVSGILGTMRAQLWHAAGEAP
jgi:hypothetical protein